MQFKADREIVLDYGEAGASLLLQNLSGIAAIGEFLWTVSDEGRTVECLKRQGDAYRLHDQIRLDDLISSIPGQDKDAELDLESIDIADGMMWLCGSHCRVRRKPKEENVLRSEFRERPSRHFLGALDLAKGWGKVKRARTLPFAGSGSLRDAIANDPFLEPFLELPSKENGLDIEGLLARDDALLLGLRGPLVDNIAVVLNLKVDLEPAIDSYSLTFLDLGGLAVRDLARHKSGVLVLAGPVNDAPGPFRLYAWEPQSTQAVQRPTEVAVWPAGLEKPEGVSELARNGEPGFIFIYDNPEKSRRLDGTRYCADWISQSTLT